MYICGATEHRIVYLLISQHSAMPLPLCPNVSTRLVCLLGVLAVLMLIGCSSTQPIEDIRRDLTSYPEYAVILEDMKTEGSLFQDYYHRYKIMTGRSVGGDSLDYETTTTDWRKVSEDVYNQYRNYLGMTILSKTPDGEVTDTAYPPGYQYVGNPRYGHWEQRGGNSFWVFYGQYRLFSDLLGGGLGRVSRTEYDDFRTTYSSGQVYYGRGNKYGTNGSVTKATNPTFYQRRQARTAASRSRGTTSRSRSRGFGK